MITGTTEPTFTPDAGAALNLNHVTVLKDEPVFDNVIHKSILNGAQKLLIKGYHWAFEVNVNLFKEANPTAKYDEIYSRLYTLGKLQRHRDGCFIQDSSLEPVYFYMTEVVPYYLQSDNLINPLMTLLSSGLYRASMSICQNIRSLKRLTIPCPI